MEMGLVWTWKWTLADVSVSALGWQQSESVRKARESRGGASET